VAGLWNDPISFGELVALIFADLLILPVLNIYRRSATPDRWGERECPGWLLGCGTQESTDRRSR
jgi:hypothetical protein